jgi:hypothetical protein
MIEAHNEVGTSWVRKYFEVKEILVKKFFSLEHENKISTLSLSDVCNGSIATGDLTDVCGTAFARTAFVEYNQQNRTKTLQRHLLKKHQDNESIANEILYRNVNCFEGEAFWGITSIVKSVK